MLIELKLTKQQIKLRVKLKPFRFGFSCIFGEFPEKKSIATCYVYDDYFYPNSDESVAWGKLPRVKKFVIELRT